MPPREALQLDEIRHGPEDQQPDPVVRRRSGFVHLLAERAPLRHRVRPEDPRLARCRRFLPFDQLHRVRAPQRRQRAGPHRARRAADGDRGRGSHLARAGIGPQDDAQARRGRGCAVRRGAIVDRECPCARDVRSRYLASEPPPFPLRGRQAAERSGGGVELGHAVRRPRPLQGGQRQPRPRPRRPAAGDGRKPASGRGEQRIQRQCPRPTAPRPSRRRRVHDLFPGRSLGGRDRTGCATDRARRFRAVRAELA